MHVLVPAQDVAGTNASGECTVFWQCIIPLEYGITTNYVYHGFEFHSS
jgi:hypothetical protein